MIIVSDLDENAWTNVEDLGNHWKSASWFGTYFDTSGNWIFHLEHGWLYRSGNSMSSTWFFDTNLNWIWTNSELYPYFYRSETNDWIFYQSDDLESRLFYDYLSESWVTLSKELNPGFREMILARLLACPVLFFLGLNFIPSVFGKPKLTLLIAEREYQTETTLPGFADQFLSKISLLSIQPPQRRGRTDTIF